MAHIIETITNVTPAVALTELQDAHDFLATRVVGTQARLASDTDHWGMATKRTIVDLAGGPVLVGKNSERFVELINILATTERTIEALQWLARHYSDSQVRECHASTSDDSEGNDIVLTDMGVSILVRCEVCDVISKNPSQNGKEKSDLKKLGCNVILPDDGVARYIATSPEFAGALSGKLRKWKQMHFAYEPIATGLPGETVMLRIVKASI
jgi:hypothetical protein